MADALERLRAALADRYRLDREIGAGGMATVYLAQDLKHDRPVALKVLRPELAASLGAERFLAEIRLTAKLQHPHIVPLFDSGRTGGPAEQQSSATAELTADGRRLTAEFLYYVMPYIEGESLRARLEREKRLDVEAMLAIARPVAQALAYAHEAGVVHRDIKPENILLSRGQPFVTDFGIARAVTVAGGERLTATGLAIGTPAYMSPEQALGDEALDARSDVYSLGCVIYELLVGKPPFSGATVQALVARRLAGPPPHVTNVPAAVDEVVRRSLATAPQDRFATAVALADALVEAARKPATPELSLVVLPFENLSPDPDNAFFADGLTEELIADLSKVRALRVISRTSAMLLKGSKKDVPTIARDLNVRYVLEGSVRRAGGSLRITAQLIDATTDAHLWAEKYSGTVDDVFDIQERVSRAIVEAMRLRLTPEEERQLAERPIDNVQAYECYHRAWTDAWTGTKEGLDSALEKIQEAIALVGENEVLLSAMGHVHLQAVNLLSEPDEAHLRQVEECVEKIRLVNPESPHAHALTGSIRYKRGDVQEAVRHFKRAYAIDSTDPATTYYLAGMYTISGKMDEARRYSRRVLELDPLTPLHQGWWAWVEALDGHFDAALEPVRLVYQTHPAEVMAAWMYVLVLSFNGRFEEAYGVIDRLAGQAPEHPLVKLLVCFKHALRGDEHVALQDVTPEVEAALRWDEHASWQMAGCHALLGHRDEALEWLEHAALNRGFINYPMLAQYDPALRNLRGDPRFASLMQRVKERWERFEV